MAKGKFESGRGTARSAGRSDPYAVRNKPAKKPESRLSKLWPILAAVGGVAVLVVGILIFTRNNRIQIPETTVAPPSTVELLGIMLEDAAYIQETLVLSKSTVSTHRQHIYQKLGIHSQQELIDLIQYSQDLDPALFE